VTTRENKSRWKRLSCNLLPFGLLNASLFDYGNFNYPQTMRIAIFEATLVFIGFQALLSAFFISLLGLR
jgi:hypothetical protein